MSQKGMLKRTLAATLSAGLVLSGNVMSVWAISGDAEHPVYEGNLLLNPDFEAGNTEWEFVNSTGSSGSGVQTNNPHTGKKGFFLDGNANGKYSIVQEVIVPYSGYYNLSGYISTGGSNAKFGIRKADETEAIKEIVLPSGASYQEAHLIPEIELKQGDHIEVYVLCGTGWTNGDDICLEYDLSSVSYNLAKDQTFSGDCLEVRTPRAGFYKVTANVSAEDETTVSCGEEQVIVPAGETKSIEFSVETKQAGDILKLEKSGTASISDVSVLLDLSKTPNEKPSAENVTLTGTAKTGQVLNGGYEFKDPDEDQMEGSTVFRWLKSNAVDGEYTEIEDQEGKTLALDDTLEGKYIKFEVTPVDNYGKAGDPVTSDPVGPVKINWVRNGSLDIEVSLFPEGWTKANGGNFSNNRKNAHTGLNHVVLPKNDEDAEMFYSFKAERTGYYDAGAWINIGDGETVLIVRNSSTGEGLKSQKVTASPEGYQFISMKDVPLEKGMNVQLAISGNSGAKDLYADDFEMIINDKEAPAYANLFSFEVEGQIRDVVIDSEKKTIEATVPYETDLSSITVKAEISEGAEMTPASGTKVDFSNGPVEFTIKNGNAVNKWSVQVNEADKIVRMKSDNKVLEEGFNWAAQKTQQFVMTGKTGVVNKSESNTSGTGTAEYMPSYWAGYYDRSAFYGRDFVHQATGAELVGLTEENYRMFETFAKGATEARKWYTLWAFNFDGSIYTLDYYNDNSFVREVPAQFELVEKAYKQYLWSGDERYISDDMFNFYTKVMTDYVELHDTNGNGIAEGTGKGIFSGSCTYNERGGQPIIEAGDAIGSQYQATLAYAGFLKARGDNKGAEQWYKKAADLKKYFNEEWSVIDGDKDGRYARALSTDGVTKYNDFGKENSWFMPLKMITEPGQRTDEYLDFITENLADGIGTGPNAPSNIEAYTYVPDMYFLYNRNDEAWKWMQYILSVKDNPHERPSQGTNGDYPEISYTLVSQTVEGMMGVTPNAQLNQITTVPRLPGDVPNATLEYQEIGNNEINLTHASNTKSELENVKGNDLTWEAQFYGEFAYINIDGKPVKAETKEINGETVSYVTATVPAGSSVTAEAVSAEEGEAIEAAAEVDEKIDSIGNVTLESKGKIEEARTAYDALNDEAKTYVTKLNVLEAAEAKLRALENEQDEIVKAAEKVEAMINDLGTITLNSKDAVKAARAAYDALSDEAKALVGNLNVLEAAEKRLDELEKEDEATGVQESDKDKKPGTGETDSVQDKKPVDSKNVKTGDTTSLFGAFAGIAASLVGITYGIRRRRRK